MGKKWRDIPWHSSDIWVSYITSWKPPLVSSTRFGVLIVNNIMSINRFQEIKKNISTTQTIKISYHTKCRRYSISDLVEQIQATPSFLLQIYCFLLACFSLMYSMLLALFTVFLNELFFLFSYDLSIFTQPLVCNVFPPLFHKWNMPYLPN